MKKRLETSSPAETREFGRKVASLLKEGDVLLLEGDLGAGKTTLMKGIASFFREDESVVTSPTFTLMQIYGERLAHFDLYRLESTEEFLCAGLQEYVETPPYIAVIEWPEHVKPILHKPWYTIQLAHLEEDKREITHDFELSEVQLSCQ